MQTFDQWWDRIGSGITPEPGANMEQHARAVASAAWNAASPDEYTTCYVCNGIGRLQYIHDTICAPRPCGTCNGTGRVKNTH